MNSDEIIEEAKRLQARISGSESVAAARAQVCEFFRNYAAPGSAFLEGAVNLRGGTTDGMVLNLHSLVGSFVEYLEAGLATGVSPERRAQLDIVSDLLGQAHSLLENDKYHPAAPAVLVGACLEEFLRTWVEGERLSIGNAKPGIDAYVKALRAAELITKQDVKDVTSWAGTRNHAAHGDWGEVSDRSRIRLMLEGVNLFMRQKQGA